MNVRPRRLRRTPVLRALVREHRTRVDQLVQPLFIVALESDAGPISSMPGVDRFTVEGAVREAQDLFALGVKSVLLFGIPEFKDAVASSNYDPNGVVQRAIRAIKSALPEMLVIADLCNCEYTDHGHCGIVERSRRRRQRQNRRPAGAHRAHVRRSRRRRHRAVRHDGRTRRSDSRLRSTPDDYVDVAIMAYSAKYASAFYGPFREAADSTPQFGDRRTYQMDPPNAREALREMALDIEEGADIDHGQAGLALSRHRSHGARRIRLRRLRFITSAANTP